MNISRKKSIIKFIFGMLINNEVFCKLILSLWVCVTIDAQSTQNKFAYLCNISRKIWGMKLIFCLQINLKVFHKLIVSRWVCRARHIQSSQNSKFECLKENVNDEVDFLPADKRQKFLQIDTIILVVCVQVCPNYPK